MTAIERPDKKETTRRWKQLEKDLAKLLSGRLTPGSGNQSIKGDVKSKVFRAEAKYRWNYDEKLGYFYMPIDLQWIEGIWNQCRLRGETPILALEQGDGSRVVLLPTKDYNRYMEYTSVVIDGVATGRVVEWNIGGNLHYSNVEFTDLEIPEKVWTVVSWEHMREIRQAAQEPIPKPKSKWERPQKK